jgi:hypothetical protein
MTGVIRMPRSLFEDVKADLARPHAFAYERVGFLYGSSVQLADRWLVFPQRYVSVQDGHYLRDEEVGARIGRAAIREALQRALDERASVLHVHAHLGRSLPGFSQIDSASLAELIPAFAGVAAGKVHGGLVVNEAQGAATVWLPGEGRARPARVSIVGLRTVLCGARFSSEVE